jgi:branched-chain amino acid transport system substrate-binding protein
MKALGVSAKFMGGDGICSSALPKLAGDALADNMVYCAEAGGVDEAGKPAMEKFRADFKKKFGVEVQVYAPYVYDSVNIMADAMVRAGSADPAKYLKALHATKGYQGVTGVVTFDKKGDIENGALTLMTYRGGERTSLAVIR